MLEDLYDVVWHFFILVMESDGHFIQYESWCLPCKILDSEGMIVSFFPCVIKHVRGTLTLCSLLLHEVKTIVR